MFIDLVALRQQGRRAGARRPGSLITILNMQVQIKICEKYVKPIKINWKAIPGRRAGARRPVPLLLLN